MKKDLHGLGLITPVVLVTLFFSFLILISFAQAVETVSQGKSGLPPETSNPSLIDNIIGMGSASVLKNVDQEEAKEKALEQAKNEAILKVVGLYVSLEIVAKEKENLLRLFKGEKDKIIGEIKIVSEETSGDGFYRVKISARIKEEPLKALLMKNLDNDRVIVITSEKNLGHSLKKRILEHDLIQRIKEKGYTIVDYRTIKDTTRLKLISSIRSLDTESVKKLGLYYLTDLVVVGFVESEFSQKNKDIYSATASGQVKIHQVSNKKEIASLTKFHEKGFGSNEEKAGLEAIKKLSQMAEEAIKSLPKKYLKNIKLSMKEIGGYTDLKKARNLIAAIPYVKAVKDGPRNLKVEEAVLFIKTTRDSDYVASKLSGTEKFLIRKLDPSGISLEAKKL